MKYIIWGLLFLGIFNPLFGKEVHYLARSPRALLMGDAYTSNAFDEFSLAYNPATLGAHDGVSLDFLNPVIAGPDVVDINLNKTGSYVDRDETDRFKDLPKKDPAALAERFLGQSYHFKLGIFPSVKMQHFGLLGFAQATANIDLQNIVHPILSIDYRYDRGIMMGYAFNIGNGGSKIFRDHQWHRVQGLRTSFGLGLKQITRSSLVRDLAFFGTEIISAVQNDADDGLSTVRKRLGYSTGSGIGFDVGVNVLYASTNSDISTGFSVTDVGDTRYKLKEGTWPIPKQNMHLNWGFSFSQDFGLFRYQYAFDLHPFNEAIDFQRKIHMGVSFGFLKEPGFEILFGWNGGYYSWGIGMDLFFMKLLAGTYGVEVGPSYRSEVSKRAIVYLNILNIAF